MRRINIKLEDDLHRDFKLKSIKDCKTMQIVVEELIKNYVRGDKKGI